MFISTTGTGDRWPHEVREVVELLWLRTGCLGGVDSEPLRERVVSAVRVVARRRVGERKV